MDPCAADAHLLDVPDAHPADLAVGGEVPLHQVTQGRAARIAVEAAVMTLGSLLQRRSLPTAMAQATPVTTAATTRFVPQ